MKTIQGIVASLLITWAAVAHSSEVISDEVFIFAAKEIRNVITSKGTDVAELHVKQCYEHANKEEKEFGPIHTTCVTQDYLLTSVLALPYDRASWYPPYNKLNRYEILVPEFRSRVANIHLLLKTPHATIDDTRQRMFFVGVKAFK